MGVVVGSNFVNYTWLTEPFNWATNPNNWTDGYTAWTLSITEGWTSSEQEAANNIKKIFESWNNAETVSHAWQDFIKILEGFTTTELAGRGYNPTPWVEGWHNSDVVYNSTTKSESEGWTTSDAITKVPTSIHNEAWSNTEQLSKISTKSLLESWVNAENIAKVIIKFNSEGWINAESISKSQTSVQNEAWCNADLLNRAMTKKILESWSNVDSMVNFFTKLNFETTKFIELWSDLSNYHLNIAEAWANAELGTKGFTKTPFVEGWATADLDKNSTNKHSNEGWINYESVFKAAAKASSEGWTTKDLENQSFTKAPFGEGWTTVDSNSTNFVKSVVETWLNSETFSRVWDAQALIAELWNTSESLREQYGLNEQEVFQTIDAYLKNANAVVSDLAFASGDLSVSDFLNMTTPVGYNPFTEFIPGELEYQKALIAIILNGPLTTGRPQITEWQLTVDVPNQTDSGTFTLPAANIFIPFNLQFYTAPDVMVQLRGGSTGTPDITDITDKGFNVEIQDNVTDLPIAGDIVWSANGY